MTVGETQKSLLVASEMIENSKRIGQSIPKKKDNGGPWTIEGRGALDGFEML